MLKKSLLLTLSTCLLLFSFFTEAANDKALFWKISSSKTQLYLLGSIHLADQSFYPLRSTINDAFRDSDKLVVEVNINKTSSQTIQQWIAQHGSYAPGDSIKHHLKPSTYNTLQSYLKQQELPAETLQQYKPGLLVNSLASIHLMKLGLLPQYGIDLHFITLAEQQHKPILELENTTQQLELFVDQIDGNLLIEQSLQQFEQLPTMIKDIVFYWKEGNTYELNRLLLEDEYDQHPDFEQLYDTIIKQRNIAMSDKLSRLLATSEIHFVVIGAGHLIGKDSIIKRLEAEGFDSQRL